MIKKVDHIGLAVSNLDEIVKMFSELLGLEADVIADNDQLKAAFIQVGDIIIEPIQPVDQNKTIAKFIKEHGNGIHHICFEVDDVDKDLEALAAKGVKLLDETGRKGLTGKVGFIQPSETENILIELVQKTDE
ncbi:VOC family protein [Chloroflexota bacterium]